jgi:aminoglycoside phosphotransferase
MKSQKLNKLTSILSSYLEREVIAGRLGDKIIRYEDNDHNFVYLKSGTGVSGKSLEREALALEWLSGKGITIPQILDFEKINDTTYLLVSGVKGLPPYKFKEREKDELLKITADALRKFHRISLENSGSLNTLDKYLKKIEQHLKLGVIKEADFKEANEGKTPVEVLDFLVAERPKFENNVLTHGDFCLPNILLEDDGFGIIDLGDCGPGDKYMDLSSMEVSIKRNFGAEWVEVFNKHYDPNLKIDKDKIKYYQLIDQFGYHLDIDKFYLLTKDSVE